MGRIFVGTSPQNLFIERGALVDVGAGTGTDCLLHCSAAATLVVHPPASMAANIEGALHKVEGHVSRQLDPLGWPFAAFHWGNMVVPG